VRPKLLLADDSVTIQRVIELTFADENVEVVAVGDGKEAIDKLESDPPDIVLADIGMPERNGYEVAEFIKGNPRFTHIPVLLLTGAFEPVDDARARSIGCDGVLVKPFEPQMVISRVRELLAAPHAKVAGASTTKTVASSSGPVEVKGGAAAPTPGAPAAAASPDTLGDYFDRLDAALANLGTASSPPPIVEAPVRTQGSGSSAEVRTAADAHSGGAFHGGAPLPPLSGPAMVQSARPAATAPASKTDVPLGPVPTLHAAFTALLAAERGEPVTATLPVPEPLSDETIEEIVKRVVARMGDEKMRALVLDAAERLVREEIDRIKSQA
jgi:CheY-like chemotaxis protein